MESAGVEHSRSNTQEDRRIPSDGYGKGLNEDMGMGIFAPSWNIISEIVGCWPILLSLIKNKQEQKVKK